MIIESFVYSASQMFLGLLIHPYRSMQLLVRNKVLIPFALYPVILLLLILLLLNVIDVVGLLYQQSFLFSFLVQWLLFYCFYWQLILLYLFLRFYLALT